MKSYNVKTTPTPLPCSGKNAVTLVLVLFVILLFTRSGPASETRKSSGKPNIVLIMADDMGYECLGVNGSTEYTTPNLDRLAQEGIRFKHCYSQPICTPSRVKIMTGKFNFRNYEDFGYLSPREKTFGNMLKNAGYSTCIAGKWQLNGLYNRRAGNQDASRPNHFGFEEYSLWQLIHKRSKNGERYANPLITQNGSDLSRDADAYGPQIFADYLKAFIDKQDGNKPFFIYYPMVLPHAPFVPTPDSPEWTNPEHRYKNDTALFSDMIAYVDKIAGQLEAKLKEKGLWENTLFIFTADNGTHQNIISSTTYGKIQGGKGKKIIAGNHVPMIITWPRKIKESRVFPGLVDFADILPTLADAAGISPAAYQTDGKSMLEVLEGDKKRKDKEEIFIHYTPRWGSSERHDRWVMDQEYKLYQGGRFFNISADPLEKTVITTPSGKEKKIKARFEKIIQEKEHEFPFNWNNEKY